MSETAVASILDGISSQVAITLPAYSALAFVHDLSKNARGAATSRWGVRALGLAQVDGVHNYYTVDQRFEFVLTKEIAVTGATDSGVNDLIESLFEAAHDLYGDMCASKAQTPSKVLIVTGLEISDPEFVSAMVVLRARITVKYRSR
jgi:hypothetical protein